MVNAPDNHGGVLDRANFAAALVRTTLRAAARLPQVSLSPSTFRMQDEAGEPGKFILSAFRVDSGMCLGMAL